MSEEDNTADFFTLTAEELKQRATDTVDRMMAAFEINRKGELAAIVGCDSKGPGKWIKKGKVPEYAILICHYKTKVSLDWLYNGEAAALVISDDTAEALQSTVREMLMASETLRLIAKTETEVNGFGITAQQITAALIKQLKRPKKPTQEGG